MKTLKVGIADYEAMKARTMRIARGEERPRAAAPKVWFTSIESFARLLSVANRGLLSTIIEQSPESLEELAQLTGRAKSNLSRTMKRLAECGLVELEPGEGKRLKPKVRCDRVTLELPLADEKALQQT